MGYDLYITRRDQWGNPEAGPEITAAEWLAFVDSDPDWELAGYNGPTCAIWLPSAFPKGDVPWTDWLEGDLYSRNPTAPMAREMMRITKYFGAKIQGDHGEWYETEADVERWFC